MSTETTIKNRKKVVAKRYTVNKQIVAETRTIGTDTDYTFTVKNLSQSGVLLSLAGAGNAVPFRQNTLIEMNIFPNHSGEKENTPIKMLGRVIRRLDLVGNSVELGIMFNEDCSDLETWAAYVATIESGSYNFYIDNSAEQVDNKKYRHKLNVA